MKSWITILYFAIATVLMATAAWIAYTDTTARVERARSHIDNHEAEGFNFPSTAQPNQTQSTNLLGEIGKIGDNIGKFNIVVDACSDAAIANDMSIVPDCMEVITKFNGYMDRFMNETKPSMATILLG